MTVKAIKEIAPWLSENAAITAWVQIYCAAVMGSGTKSMSAAYVDLVAAQAADLGLASLNARVEV
jgi:hypothetical protein